MSTLGYLKQVICEVTLHFGSNTDRVLKSEGTLNNRVEEATARTKISSAEVFLHQLTYCLAFNARARSLQLGHYVFHHRAHVFHGG